MNNTEISEKVISLELEKAIQSEMQNWNINPIHLPFIKEQMQKALYDAESKDNLLCHVGSYVLPRWNETKNLVDHRKDFKSFFDEDLINWNLNEKQNSADELRIITKKMQSDKNGTYQTIYDSLARPLESMAIDQNRICQILFSDDIVCKKIRQDLDLKNTWTHFLVKRKDGSFFVVNVNLDGDGLSVPVDELALSHVWYGEREFLFVTLA